MPIKLWIYNFDFQVFMDSYSQHESLHYKDGQEQHPGMFCNQNTPEVVSTEWNFSDTAFHTDNFDNCVENVFLEQTYSWGAHQLTN